MNPSTYSYTIIFKPNLHAYSNLRCVIIVNILDAVKVFAHQDPIGSMRVVLLRAAACRVFLLQFQSCCND